MAGIQGAPLQAGMIGAPTRGQRQGYSDPVTGSPNENPVMGVDPSQQYDAATRLALQNNQAKLHNEAQDKLIGAIPSITGAAGGSANVQYPGGVSPQQSQAAVEAEFARAKDKSGQIAKSAITGLNDSMAGRGMLGSGIHGDEMARIMSGQAGQLDDLNREQAIQGLQYQTHANDMQYQGDITQRAQNMGLTQSLLGLLRSGGVAY